MLTAVLAAVALTAGVPWPVAALIGASALAPVPVAAAVIAVATAHALLHRPARTDAADEAIWLAAVAAELRGGASLRFAMVAACARVPALALDAVERMALSGAPIEAVGSKASVALPHTGQTVAAALTIAGDSGGKAAAVFERLAAHAWERVEARRQRTTLTAQARLSAWVVGGLPVAALGLLAVTGRLALVLGSGPFGVGAMAVGLVLEATGLATVVVMLKKAAS